MVFRQCLELAAEALIDTAKSAAILLANTGYNARELYNGKFAPVRALPIVAINLNPWYWH